MTCSDKKPSIKQRNWLIKLAGIKQTGLTADDMCCSKHTSKAITRMRTR